jgi:hypothetical protein
LPNTPPETELTTPLRPTTQTSHTWSRTPDPAPMTHHHQHNTAHHTTRTTVSQNHRPNTLRHPAKHHQTPKPHKNEPVKWLRRSRQRPENRNGEDESGRRRREESDGGAEVRTSSHHHWHHLHLSGRFWI